MSVPITIEQTCYRTELSEQESDGQAKINRDGQSFIQAMVKQVETELKKAQVAVVGTMDEGDEALLAGKGAEINHPQIGETGSQQDAGQAVWVSDMTFIEVKASTFLVRKEGFDAHAFAIPVTDFVAQVEIRDQKERSWIGFVPPDDDRNRAYQEFCV